MQETTSEAEDEAAGGVTGSDNSSEESDAEPAGHEAKPSEPEAPEGKGDSSMGEGGDSTSNPKKKMPSADVSPDVSAEMQACEESAPKVHDATGPKDSAGKPGESTPALAPEAKQHQVEPVSGPATSKDETGSEGIFARSKYDIARFVVDSILFNMIRILSI